jgi:hypothetical protein
MSQMERGCRARLLQPPNYNPTRFRRPDSTTAVNPVNTCAGPGCARAARAAHVPRPGGEQQRLCPRHWLIERNREQADGVRRRVAALFRNCWPQVSRPGAFLPAWEAAI